MRVVPLGVAIVALVVGIALVGISLYGAVVTTTSTPPSRGALTIRPSTIGPLRATIEWTQAGSGSVVYVTDQVPSCYAPSGVVASGSGNNGSLSVSMNPGTTYYLFGCAIGGVVVTPHFSYTLFGLTIELLLGILLIVSGAFALLVALRPRSPSELTEHAEPAATKEVTPPASPLPENMRVPPVFDEQDADGAGSRSTE